MHYNKGSMPQGRKMSEEQQYLPSNLLQDDDLPTTTSLKQEYDEKRSISFSAPPMLFDFGYEFDSSFKEFCDFNVPESNNCHTSKAYSKNGSQTCEDIYTPPVNSIRKLSLQNQDYDSYQNVSVPTSGSFYEGLTPEQELLNNLPQVAQWSRDQNGSRAVQNIFENGQEYTKELLFSFIFKESQTLIKDRFGNYVFQKILERGTEKQKKKIFSAIKGRVVDLSEHCYGCRVVQKAAESIQIYPQLQEQLISEITPSALHLIQNQNGNHVLQKCCEIFSPKALSGIANCILENLKKLAFHPYGCRVIQKYLENCNQGPSEQEEILQRLVELAFELSQCQYGNYVIQHIILNCEKHKPKVLKVLYENFIKLSFNKYASNVIEKVIKSSEGEYVDKLAQLAIDSSEIVVLSKHQFGNYVIQSLVEKTQKDKKAQLKSKIKENAHEITKSQYGRHVLMQVQKSK